MIKEHIKQREKGLEFLAQVLSNQSGLIIHETHPWELKSRKNYDSDIGLQKLRDIYVTDSSNNLEHLVSLSTEPFTITQFVAKLIASSNMGIHFIPVLRKSIESRTEDNGGKGKYSWDGPFYKRTLSRKSMTDTEKRRQFNVIDTKVTERFLATYATLNCIPYFQPETEGHRYSGQHSDSLRIYSFRTPTLDHLYTGMPWAWARSPYKSKKFKEAILQNVSDNRDFSTLPLIMTAEETEKVRKNFLKLLSSISERSERTQELISKLEAVEEFYTGILTPHNPNYRNGFPLLFLNLRYAMQTEKIMEIDNLRKSIETRLKLIHPNSPLKNYEHKLYAYHNEAIKALN
ncbi:MAG: hypothetical protein AABW92_03545 [Nanoarchaeota archaeon]